MSTRKDFDTRYSVFVASVLLVAFIMGISLIPRYLTIDSETPRSGNSAVLDPSQASGSDVFPPIPPEESTSYAILGTVISIEDNTKTLNLGTAYGIRAIDRTTETLYFSQEWPTAIERRDLTADELFRFFTKNSPATDTIVAGDTIIAQNTTNISGLNRFTASKITIIK